MKTLPGTTVTMTTDPINECASEKLTVHELQTNLLRSEKEFLNGVMNDTIPEQTSQTVNAKLNEGTTLTDDRNESSIITLFVSKFISEGENIVEMRNTYSN